MSPNHIFERLFFIFSIVLPPLSPLSLLLLPNHRMADDDDYRSSEDSDFEPTDSDDISLSEEESTDSLSDQEEIKHNAKVSSRSTSSLSLVAGAAKHAAPISSRTQSVLSKTTTTTTRQPPQSAAGRSAPPAEPSRIKVIIRPKNSAADSPSSWSEAPRPAKSQSPASSTGRALASRKYGNDTKMETDYASVAAHPKRSVAKTAPPAKGFDPSVAAVSSHARLGEKSKTPQGKSSGGGTHYASSSDSTRRSMAATTATTKTHAKQGQPTGATQPRRQPMAHHKTTTGSRSSKQDEEEDDSEELHSESVSEDETPHTSDDEFLEPDDKNAMAHLDELRRQLARLGRL